MTTAPTSDPLRIALCVGEWLPASETFIYDQLVHQRRVRARVIARERTAFADRFPYDDVVHLGRLETLGFYQWGVAPTVTRALKDHGARLVHAHFGPNGTRILPFARALGIPLVVSMHGHDVGGLEPQNREHPRYRRYQRTSAELFDYVSVFLCASTELVELMAGHGVSERKLQLHHLGVDVARFTPGPARQRVPGRVLMVGRLVEKKGMFDGISALAQLIPRRPEAHLRLIGDGPIREELEAHAASLGVSSRVTFCGALPSDDVIQEMRRATVLLTPSFTTTTGDRESGVIVVKEAGAVGLPAVVTRHGGLPEIIDEGQNGFLVPERDVTAIAERLEELLSSPDLARTMGERARVLVHERYDSVRQNAVLEEHLLRAAHATI